MRENVTSTEKNKTPETKIRMTVDIIRNNASQKTIRDIFKVLVWGRRGPFVHLVFHTKQKYSFKTNKIKTVLRMERRNNFSLADQKNMVKKVF